ncbi:hypothetical protein ACLB1G_23060 [Oxalobacteraceae bacterium A2-2]
MHRLKINLFAVLLSGGAVVSAAETARSVDASSFDVAGVKLGMSLAEAVAAAASKLQIDKRAIEIDKFPQTNPVTQSKEPAYIIVKSGLAILSVHFLPRVPINRAAPMAVSHIIYEMPWTPDNVKAMQAAAIQKYGPTSNGSVGVTYQWCARPSQNVGEGCHGFQGPTLSLSGNRLELTDPSFHQAVINFMNKSKSATPGF